MTDWMTVVVCGVVFLATLVRSSFGFGDALVAMPLLSLAIGVRTAAPLMAIISVTTATTILVRDWRRVHLSEVWRLVLSAWCGIPLGVWVLTQVDEHWLKRLLGVAVTGFAVYNLRHPELPELKSDRSSLLFGFLAGFFGGACNVQGPPLVIYGSLRRWSAQHFRATTQAFALPSATFLLVMHGMAGLWKPAVFRFYAFCVPAVIVAVLLGRVVNRKVANRDFVRWIYAMLVFLGLALVVESFWQV